MAPELSIGGRASFASDVWSLAVVMHEIVLGRKPIWNSSGKGMQRPSKRLTGTERAVWNVCRQCAVSNPARRPQDATLVAARLRHLEAGRPAAHVRRIVIALVVAALALTAVVAAGTVYRNTSAQRRARSPIVTTAETVTVRGMPDDWTRSSRVLATVPGRISCLLALPDHRTLRFVWGTPASADDLDLPTGRRRSSPLVPAAYAVGCPDLSPDGQNLIFEGYDDAHRPVIFRSPRPDGSNAAVVAQTDGRHFGSGPRWFADGKAFVFDVDGTHAGIIEGDAAHLTIASGTPSPEFRVLGWTAGGSRVFLVGYSTGARARFEALDWPAMTSSQMLVVPFLPFDCQPIDGSALYCAEANSSRILAVRPSAHTVNPVAELHGEGLITFLAPEPNGLAFVTQRRHSDLWSTPDVGLRQKLTSDGTVLEAAPCGDDTYLLTRDFGETTSIVSRRQKNGNLADMTAPSFYQSPVCTGGGQEWWFQRIGPQKPGFFHCTDAGCTVISHELVRRAALSPDGTRIAYLTMTNRGMTVRVMSTTGQNARSLVDSETACPPGWSSNDTLWVSRLRKGKALWIEINATTAAETQRTAPGGKDCTDDDPDPLSPVHSEARVMVERQSQIRWKSLP